MIGPADPADPATAAALIELQRAAYALEAALLGVPDLPPMRETASDLARDGLTYLVARNTYGGNGSDPFQPEVFHGIVAYRRDGDVVDVHKLAVHPQALRQGLASRLLDAVEARERGARRWLVGTGEGNAPALALYGGRGFTAVRVQEVAPGLRWVQLERVPSDRR